MNEFVLITGMALVTFIVRYPVLALVGRFDLPDGMVRALRFVPAAVLTAIILPEILLPEGNLDFSLGNAHLIGAFVAALIAWRTHSLLWTIILGMVAFVAWRALVG